MISVCVTTYNGGKYISEQLASILQQLGADDEVIVSDDGSTDDTIALINAIADPRIHIINHVQEPVKFKIDYSTHNFVNAMNHSHGDVIFLSDQDDCWLPGKVETMMKALQHSDLVMSDCAITDAQLNPISASYNALRPFRRGLLSNFIASSFLGSCMAFRREVFVAANPFPRYGVAHDIWLGMVALRHFKVDYVSEPLMLYRRHDSTMTASGKSNTTSLLFKIHYRLYLLKAMLRLL